LCPFAKNLSKNSFSVAIFPTVKFHTVFHKKKGAQDMKIADLETANSDLRLQCQSLRDTDKNSPKGLILSREKAKSLFVVCPCPVAKIVAYTKAEFPWPSITPLNHLQPLMLSGSVAKDQKLEPILLRFSRYRV
jgi:hypothetical protein